MVGKKEVSVMLGQPKGYVFIKEEIRFSRKPGWAPFGNYDLTEDYFNALQMRLVPVWDVAVDGSSYLVFGKGEKSGGFIWGIDKRDTTGEMIPYKLIHPGLDWGELIGIFGRMLDGKLTAEDYDTLQREVVRFAREKGVEA